LAIILRIWETFSSLKDSCPIAGAEAATDFDSPCVAATGFTEAGSKVSTSLLMILPPSPLPFTKEMSIPHEVSSKFSSSKLTMMPNNGKGLVAGSTVRDMLILAGIKNITAKLHSGSKNKLNNARAAYPALYLMKTKPGNQAVKIDAFVAEKSPDVVVEDVIIAK
jgi:hypothetical protein